jgi:hypothetical protein
MVVELAAQIGFVGEGGAQEVAIVKVVIDAFLELDEALFPLGILLADLFAADVFHDAGNDAFEAVPLPRANDWRSFFCLGHGRSAITFDHQGGVVSAEAQ